MLITKKHLIPSVWTLVALLSFSCGGSQKSEELSAALKADERPVFSPEYAFPIQTIEYPENHELAYIDEGQGDTVIVFVHGLGGYLKHWEGVVGQLKDSYRCIAVDLPSYGYSSRAYHQVEDPMLFYAGALRQLTDQLGVSKVFIAGHSMGGQVAMVAALAFPESVAGLILAAPAGFETFSTMEGMGMKAVATADYFAKQGPEEIRNSFNINFYEMPANAEALIQERINMRDTYGFEAYCHTVEMGIKGMLGHPVKDELSKISQPVLVMFGEGDKLIPNPALHADLSTEQVAEAGMALLPKASLQFIPEAGHLLNYEKPTEVAQHIRNWLQSDN